MRVGPSAVPPFEPFYFGPPERPLFGCHHRAAPPSGAHAVVLCPPIGHESIQIHRALRQLAGQLAQAGLDTLRFDYSGCGDSSGESSDARLEDWIDDVHRATATVRARSGARRVHLVGLRLGGTLALLAAATRADIDAVALWDPVTTGGGYVDELTALHREMRWTAHVPLERAAGRGERTELVGLTLTARMVADLRALDLADTARLGQVPSDVLVVTTRDDTAVARLAEGLARRGAAVAQHHMPNDALWAWTEDLDHVIVPQGILREVNTWLADRST